MKKFITAAIIILAALGSRAQQTQALDHGFWVAESNKENPKVQTIKFYNDRARLLYQETLSKPINVSKKKNQVLLNAICQRVNRQRELITNGGFITAVFDINN